MLWSFFVFGQKATPIVQKQLHTADSLFNAAEYELADSLLKQIYSLVLDLDDPEVALQVLHLSGFIGLEQGDFSRASSVFAEAVRKAQISFDQQHPSLGQAYNDQGHYFFTVGQVDSAWHYHQQALAIRLKNFGETHKKVADSYNNLGNVLQRSGRFQEALAYYEEVLQIRRHTSDRDPLAIASALSNQGNAYLSLGQLPAATRTLQQVLRIRQSVLGTQHPSFGRSLQNLSNAHFQANQIDSAQYYLRLALSNAQNNYGAIHPTLANLYESLGNCNVQKMQLDSAENWHQKALVIREELVDADPIAPAASYLYLGDIYRQKGDFLEALNLTEKGVSILQKHLNNSDPFLAEAYEKLGHCRRALGHLLEAREVYTQALDIRLKIFGPGHPLVAGSYTNLGNVYWQQSDHYSAVAYYQDALTIWEQFGPKYNQQKVNLYNNLGNSHFKEKTWTEALDAYQKALDLAQPSAIALKSVIWQQIGSTYDRLVQYPAALRAFEKSIELFKQGSQENSFELLYIQSAQANTLWHLYEQNNNLDTLQLATSAFLESLDLLEQQQSAFAHLESRQKTVELHYDLFEGAINCQLTHWEIEKDSAFLWRAFQLSESSKGLRLRERWLNDTTQVSTSSTKAESPGLSLAEVLQTDDIAARFLEQQLKTRRGLLAFFSGTQQLFWFYLKAGRLQAGKIPKMQRIHELVSVLGQSIINYPMVSSAQKLVLDSIYRDCAQELYTSIWLPIEPAFDGNKEIIIIPDASLAYLPFASLLTTAPDQPMQYRSYPFLLRDYQISYAYSASLLAKALSKASLQNKGTCLAMAPTFEGHHPPLAPLTHNTLEVDGLGTLIGAKTLLDTAATFANFLNVAPQYQILHLATHGVANIYRSEYCYLAFSAAEGQSKNRLYVQDLYKLDLPFDLVVMSACESGTGLFHAGEGQISLGRGFVAAGARSVVSTLWSVNDAKTADFMFNFYRHLKQGTEKDEAIRLVQQQYLATASHDDAHPFYWAAYVPIGDMSSLKIGRSGLKKWWPIGLLGLLLLSLRWLKPGLLKNFSK